MAKNKNALFLSVGRFWKHINGKHKTLQKNTPKVRVFIEKSPTEDNLSPSFWTCFSHYHEKVATLRSAFFDITHSERKKHSSLLGVLFSGADNQIRTGDLVLTKDVLYLLSHISKILRATCGKVRIAPRLSLSMIPILPAKVNRLR